jgi:hypothetical protein
VLNASVIRFAAAFRIEPDRDLFLFFPGPCPPAPLATESWTWSTISSDDYSSNKVVDVGEQKAQKDLSLLAPVIGRPLKSFRGGDI